MEQTPSGVEIIRPWQGFDLRCALFDFDGTISLIREGWQGIMIPYFTEVLQAAAPGEDPEAAETCVRDFVDTLTGKQTIFQCIRLDEEVQKRGGPARDPLTYKREYLRRLEERIHSRKEALAQGRAKPEDYLVPGAGAFLALLRESGIRCYLASGTDEEDVLREARLLGLEGLFAGGIHGAHDGMTDCSKELVIRDMLEREHILPKQLVSFGDGYVEVELVARLGGLAVGAATNEETRQGINEWKRRRLVEAGANAIIPDFREGTAILEAIRRDCYAVSTV
ncbi:MAG: HAD family hydrolase [Oscillibacter sp.]|nr:HAD family hydrolase [Oscillibacter sp.]